MFMKACILLLDNLLGINTAGWLLYGSGSTYASRSSAGLETTSICLMAFANFADLV